ncbi:MAG: tRNA (adenosine(37)-N6)-threonylcarbamoyltransferase complex dimerization subunit type 1 TsaB [Candidatus Baltobacteraceae bacterium]
MKVVALDGAFGGFSAAVTGPAGILAHLRVEGNVALERGLGLVVQAMAEAGVTPAAVDRLAVSLGPGAFTGLRIAISYAKALALGWERPLVGVGSFDALEHGIGPLPDLAVISAKAGTASVRLRVDGRLERFSGSTQEICDRTAAAWGTHELRVAGAPEDVLCGLGERGIPVRTLEIVQPPAVAVALIGAGAEPAPSPHAIRADYGEAAPAKIPGTR